MTQDPEQLISSPWMSAVTICFAPAAGKAAAEEAAAEAAMAAAYTAPRILGRPRPTPKPGVACVSTCGEVAGTSQIGMDLRQLKPRLDALDEAYYAAHLRVLAVLLHIQCHLPSPW